MNLVRGILVACALVLPSVANAEPANRWWSGFGQGTMEYGYNDGSKGSSIYIACGETTTDVWVNITGVDPAFGSSVTFVIDGDTENAYQLTTEADNTKMTTDNHVAADNFVALWDGMAKGKKTVTYSFKDKTGKTYSKTFPLAGSGAILKKDECQPTFYR